MFHEINNLKASLDEAYEKIFEANVIIRTAFADVTRANAQLRMLLPQASITKILTHIVDQSDFVKHDALALLEETRRHKDVRCDDAAGHGL